MDELTQRIYAQMAEITRRIGIIAASQFAHVIVDFREELPDLQPPAIAYVKEDGNYYLKYFINSAFQNTPYYSEHGNGWHPLDISSPRFDRPIHIINTRWVIVNGMTQDLEYLPRKKGLSDDDIANMPSPEAVEVGQTSGSHPAGVTQLRVTGFEAPMYIGASINIADVNYIVVGRFPADEPPTIIELDQPLPEEVASGTVIEFWPVTELGTLPPEHLVFRIGREDMENPFSILKAENNQWYMTSVECYPDHPKIDERIRYCWNVTKLADGNYPARFDRVIHVIESEIVQTWTGEELVQDVLRDQKKIVPGDVLFDRSQKENSATRRRRWDYVVPKTDEPYSFIPLEFARILTVLNRDEFDKIKKYFELTRIYVINMTHGTQYWPRYLPIGFNEYGEIIEEEWNRVQYPAEFCYWDNYD